MKITLDIPKNDYAASEEVRTEVVQEICSLIVKRLKESMDGADGVFVLRIDDDVLNSPRLFLNFPKELKNSKYQEPKNSRTQGIYKACNFVNFYGPGDKVIRIRTIEMKAAFEALQDAGYYIFGFYNTTSGEHTYVFSRRSYYHGCVAERIKFCLPID